MHTHFGSRVVVVLLVVVGVGLGVVGAGTTTGLVTEAAASNSFLDTQPSGKKKRIFWLNIWSSLNSRMKEAFLKFKDVNYWNSLSLF